MMSTSVLFALTPQMTDALKTNKPSVFQSPVFYALVAVAFLLLVFILQLSKVLTAVARNYASKQRKGFGDTAKSLLLLIGLGMFSNSTYAANGQMALDFLHDGFGNSTLNGLALIIAIELFVVLYYIMLIHSFLKKELVEAPSKVFETKTSYFWDRFNKSVALEAEAAVMTDHDYDGIRELDNSLPPWWVYGFYLTIVFSVLYMGYYHLSGNGSVMENEYKAELKQAAIQLAEYKLKAANLVDETNVVALKDDASINSGRAIYVQYCAVCHGQAGEGLVGPNFTDKFWVHGGDVKDLFKTVKYGVQGKGMKSWQQELSPPMMAQVVSYVLSLQGTNPPNAKPAEGALYEPVVAAADTTAVEGLVQQ
jgi:cytochrome c oxidase cbb3-type subunit III